MSGELVLMLGTYGTNDALRALMHHDGNAFSKASVRAIIIDATRGTDVHSNAEGVEERLGVIVHMSANVDTWPHDPLGGSRQNFLDSRDVRSFSSLPISGDWLKRCPHLPRPSRRGRTPLSARWSPRPHLQACIDAPLTLRPGAVSLVPTGIAIHTADPGPAAIVLPRSGLAHKHGTVLANLWRISPRTGSGAGGCGSSGTR